MDLERQNQIEKAMDYTWARRTDDDQFRFWDAARATWYLVDEDEMAELGEGLCARPAENDVVYDTWIDRYCEKVDPDQTCGNAQV